MFSITSIPKIMRRQGWYNGASLMEIWFSRGSAIKPAYGPPDTLIIRMSWALTFSRAKDVFDQLMRERIWANEPAKIEIRNRLQSKGLLTSDPVSRAFGSLTAPVPTLEAEYVNNRPVGGLLDPLDGMLAALGMFDFRVVVAGGVAPVPASLKFHVTITHVGVYIVDSYDFEGFQPLGTWDDKTNGASKNPGASGTTVSNADFREFRDKTGMGGDFLVFSDLLVTRLTSPDEFDL